MGIALPRRISEDCTAVVVADFMICLTRNQVSWNSSDTMAVDGGANFPNKVLHEISDYMHIDYVFFDYFWQGC